MATKWTPLDMPFIKNKAYEYYIKFAHRKAQLAELAKNSELVDDAESDGVLASTLDTDYMAWMDTDVCDLIDSTRSKLPEWTPAACIPAPHGIIGFESDFLNVMWKKDGVTTPVGVDAFSWRVYGELVSIAAWSTTAPGVNTQAGMGRVLGFITPLNEGVEALSKIEVTGRHDGESPSSVMAEVAHLMSVAGATWLLMSQPKIVDESFTSPVKVRNRNPAPGESTKRKVRVSVRSLTSSDSVQRRKLGRKAMSRWWVRGHWRQQVWGKGHKLRKPVYIAPHLAGNEDAEVDERPNIQVWKE